MPDLQSNKALRATIHDNSSIPSVSTLAKGTSCCICHIAFEDSPSHYPVMLRCGHVVGMDCVLNWLSDKEPPSSCPECSRQILNKADHQRWSYWKAREEDKAWLWKLENDDFRYPSGMEHLREDVYKAWAERAKHLWKRYCEDLLCELDMIESAKCWFDRPALPIRSTINLLTVDRFRTEAENRGSMVYFQWGDSRPESYLKLREHLHNGPKH